MQPNDDSPALQVDHFDGLSARPRPVRLQVHDQRLWITPLDGGSAWSVAAADVRWAERQRHGWRITQLPDGSSLQTADTAAWDAWARQAVGQESLVVRLQQSWRATAGAAVLLIACFTAGWFWGLPWGARVASGFVPQGVDQRIGDAALSTLTQRGLLKPSQLPAARQERLRQRFEQAVAAAYPTTPPPPHRVMLQASRIGANALALPGGTIVLTDELADLLADREDVLVGVLAHELGHVEARHGMRSLIQLGLLGAFTGFVIGDFSSLLAGTAALLGQQAYTRDFEREADAAAIRILRAAAIDPAAMTVLFERLAARQRDAAERAGALGIALASHPSDAERMQRFRDAALAR